MKKKKPPIKPVNRFVCATCHSPEMTRGEAIEHLQIVHHKQSKESRTGTRRMMAHLDCADSYHSTFQWTFGDVILYQYCANPRTEKTGMV